MSDFRQHQTESAPGLTRRQFLSYALGGTGAFMASIVAGPLVVETLDPLQRGDSGTFVNTKHKMSEFNQQLPTLIEFQAHRDDGWNSADITGRAWVIRNGSQSALAMSPICTHLGCQVHGTLGADGQPAPSQDGEWWFHCPCHGSKFSKYGINSPDSPAPRPLDVHRIKVDASGDLWVGPLQQRNRSGQVI